MHLFIDLKLPDFSSTQKKISYHLRCPLHPTFFLTCLLQIKGIKKVTLQLPKYVFSTNKINLNPIPYGHFNKPNLIGGGQICPTHLLYMLIGGYFLYLFFNRGSYLGCKGSESKSKSKILALEFSKK